MGYREWKGSARGGQFLSLLWGNDKLCHLVAVTLCNLGGGKGEWEQDPQPSENDLCAALPFHDLFFLSK